MLLEFLVYMHTYDDGAVNYLSRMQLSVPVGGNDWIIRHVCVSLLLTFVSSKL